MVEFINNVVEKLTIVPASVLVEGGIIVIVLFLWMVHDSFKEGNMFKVTCGCFIIANILAVVLGTLAVKQDRQDESVQNIVLYYKYDEVVTDNGRTSYLTYYEDENGDVWCIDDYDLHEEHVDTFDCTVHKTDKGLYLVHDGTKYDTFTHTSEYNAKEVY